LDDEGVEGDEVIKELEGVDTGEMEVTTEAGDDVACCGVEGDDEKEFDEVDVVVVVVEVDT
jgi:hypothetical protein